LKGEAGPVAYRYPLGTGRQAAQIGTVAGRVELESTNPVRNIYSPSHSIDVTRVSDKRSTVSFETNGNNDPQDFQLFYTVSREDFGVTLLTHRESGRDGYFLLMISPKDDWSEQEYSAKDIVFVLDTSGSMSEAGKMEKARAALLHGIRILRPQDRFNVIAFAGEEHLMESGLITADNAGKKRGEEFVNSLRPNGGTNINGALLAALPQFRSADRPRIIVFLTDGLPTVGETNVEHIVGNVRAARTQAGETASTGGAPVQPKVRLFTFGVGYDVNTALLDKLAAENGGVADYIEPKEDLEVKVSNFFTKISSPVLTSLDLDLAGVKTDLMYPRTLSDLFRGSQVTLIGRYKNESDLKHVRLTLKGYASGTAKSYVYENQSFPLRNEQNEFLPRLWATRRVGWLMEQVRTNGEQKELRDEIVDLGTRYGIVTPYTSYLALEQNAQVQVTSQNLSSLPVNGRTVRGAFGNIAAPKAADATTSSGVVAIQESKKARAQQEAMRDDKDALPPTVKSARGKTFYLLAKVWTDAEYKEDGKLPEVTVKFSSPEYFELLKAKPGLSSFFSLGESVVVVFEGTVYRVTP
jgi:Ca-activated chloride channel family protein